MPSFDFKAISRDGQTLTGVHEAESMQEVVRRLQADGCVPISAVPARKLRLRLVPSRRQRRITSGQLAALTFRLSSLLGAGLPIDSALRHLENTSERTHAELLEKITRRVAQGESFSAALTATGEFPSFYLSVVQAAEASGQLGSGLQTLADHLDKADVVRQQLRSALAYPTVLTIGAGASLLVVMTFVVPRLRELFDGFGTEPPALAAVVLGVSGFLTSWWWAPLLVGAVIFAAMRVRMRDPAVRVHMHRRLFALPLIGRTLQQVDAARFARTLGILLQSGVPMTKSMTLAARSVDNEALRELFEQAGANLRSGGSLSRSLTDTTLLPPLLPQLTAVGEQNGRLDEMLLRAADYFDRDSQQLLKRLVSMVEPTVIIGLGLIIGAIITSIIGAIISINELPL